MHVFWKISILQYDHMLNAKLQIATSKYHDGFAMGHKNNKQF